MVVAARVEADLEPNRGEPVDRAGAQRSTRLAGVRARLLGHCAPALRRQALDVLCDFVNSMRDATDRGREVELRQRAQAGGTRSSLFDDRLKVVPPERLGSVQRGAAQEEGRRKVCAPQDRSDDLDVRLEVVVERQGDRKGFAGTPLEDGVEPGGRNDAVPPDQVLELGRERTRAERGNQLAARIPGRIADRVVDERDAGRPGGRARRPGIEAAATPKPHRLAARTEITVAKRWSWVSSACAVSSFVYVLSTTSSKRPRTSPEAPTGTFDVVAVDRGRAIVAEVVTERRRAPKRAEARRPRDSLQRVLEGASHSSGTVGER